MGSKQVLLTVCNQWVYVCVSVQDIDGSLFSAHLLASKVLQSSVEPSQHLFKVRSL